jgi:hypothetical protein
MKKLTPPKVGASDEDFDRYMEELLNTETPIERYTKNELLIRGICYTVGGCVGLILLIILQLKQ